MNGIPHIKVGGAVRIRRSDFEDYLREHGEIPTDASR